MITVPASILAALAQHYQTSALELTHFGGGREDSDGVVYTYPFQTGRRLLKIMPVPIADQQRGRFCLDERLRFAAYLGEHGAPVVYPVVSPQGSLYETHLSDDYLWVAYSMDIAPGKALPWNTWDEAFFRRWGAALGRMHRLAQAYPVWESSPDPATGKVHLTWKEEWDSFYNWCPDPDVKAQWAAIGAQLEELPRARATYGFVHNDPHIANLLDDGAQVTMIDFDVANHHWFASDIAIACQSILFSRTGGIDRPCKDQPGLHTFLHTFMSGYETENSLPTGWLERLDLFIAYRRILLFIVMHGWISSQPDMHTSWKRMILEAPEVAGAFTG